MRRTWTIIGDNDVRLSVRWYQTLLGIPPTEPAHDYFGQILDSDGTVLLCLHGWGAHGHPSLAETGNIAGKWAPVVFSGRRFHDVPAKMLVRDCRGARRRTQPKSEYRNDGVFAPRS